MTKPQWDILENLCVQIMGCIVDVSTWKYLKATSCSNIYGFFFCTNFAYMVISMRIPQRNSAWNVISLKCVVRISKAKCVINTFCFQRGWKVPNISPVDSAFVKELLLFFMRVPSGEIAIKWYFYLRMSINNLFFTYEIYILKRYWTCQYCHMPVSRP